MFLARLGVRTRILAIALVPSLTLVVVGVGTAGYLVNESNKAKAWATELQQAGPSTQEMVESIQSERHLTMSLVAGDMTVTPALPAARTRTDAAFAKLNQIVQQMQAVDGADIGDSQAEFATSQQYLKAMRGGADAGMLPATDAYMFFNLVVDKFVQGTKIAVLAAPDATVSSGVGEGLRLLNIIEAMSRGNALGSALVAAEGNFAVGVDEFIRQSGFYRTELANLTFELPEAERNAVAALTASAQWQQLTQMDNAIIARFSTPAVTTSTTSTTKAATPPALPMPAAEWQSAAASVNRTLLDVYTGHNRFIQTLAKDSSQRAEATAAAAGGGVIALSVLAFLVALVLANRIIRRLRRLRTATLQLADEKLPATMRVLRDGGEVEASDTTPTLDFGHDEIGQVAKAFEHAAAAAIGAAVDEARTREGVRAVFLNIAHRSQIVVHRQLEILDEAERRQEDPALLETLFRLDHLATRERRNAENLIILGGGRPGRQWRQPVPVMDVVRSAIGETLDYARVRVTKLPDVNVVGTVVADLVHLLAELVDNATAFSPPQSRVEAGGNVVGKGVVVEITDQGMGMSADDLVRYNTMLADPPDFGVGTLSSDSRLGLFVVARLALAHGVSVRLSESDYGGIRAIVLIPQQLLAGEADSAGTPPTTTGPLRRGLPAPQESSGPVAALEAAPAPVATLVADPPTPRPMAPAPEAPPVQNPRYDTGSDERPALPRRSRQTNLAPELTEPAVEAPRAPERPRSAEQARDIMSAIENGTRQGRKQQTTSNQDEQEG
ncbi:sensor histidine kinase [Nocardia salmonicida]|uniref:sensor histidine kinase n=1 Tax=Nocardia salmonicida TaxID=53431 RepID=UPI002E2E360E|nr:nitrate- and nitrite sensing domain-containing protein [Nocardia salmonicida]